MKIIKFLMFFVAAATMLFATSCTKDKVDELAGTKWQLNSPNDPSFHTDVVYTVTFSTGMKMNFTRNVGGTNYVMEGTYTYKDGEGVGMLCSTGETTEYRLTFKIDGNKLVLHYHLHDITLTKV